MKRYDKIKIESNDVICSENQDVMLVAIPMCRKTCPKYKQCEMKTKEVGELNEK